jgi:gas vesicle protein
MTKKTKLVLGLVGAAAVGVAIGLLLAPEKGSDLRKRVSSTAGGWADNLSDLFARAKSGANGVRNRAGSAYSDIQESYS